MSDAPYRDVPARFFKSHGIFLSLEQVVGVVKYKDTRGSRGGSAIKVLLRSGHDLHVDWEGDEAVLVFDRLTEALEIYHT